MRDRTVRAMIQPMSRGDESRDSVLVGAPIALGDGSHVRLRQGDRSDRELLLRGLDRLTAGSRYRSYLLPMDAVSERTVRYLTEIDHHDHEAMIALDDRTGEGVGVARYLRTPDRPGVAEVAIAVIDEWRGRGVGRALLEVISARAREEGVTTFTALMPATSHEMRARLESLGQVRTVDQETGTVEVEIAMPELGVSPELRKLLAIAALPTDADPAERPMPAPRSAARA
jgi:GNAT superfamily N-acetyltransferase